MPFVRFDIIPALCYSLIQLNIFSTVVPCCPDAKGLKGEAGESPALSRNCNPVKITESQDARRCHALRTFAERG